MNIPKIIIAIGILLSSLVLGDALMPKHNIPVKVISLKEGLEAYDKGKKMRVAYMKVELDNGTLFPVSLQQAKSFTVGDSAELSVSQILRKPFFLKNLESRIGLSPLKGIFSYFLILPIALAISSALGVYYKNQYQALNNCCVFTVFFSIGTLIIVLFF